MDRTISGRFLMGALAAMLLAAALPEVLAAQDLHPSRRPSPMAIARTHVGDAYVSVTYSRPYKRNRDNVFGTKESGALVPYGEIWRTGANEATQITVTGDVQVAGQKLPAGTYSLFTTPGEKEWQVHFNSALGLNGTMRRNAEGQFENAVMPENNALTVTVPVGATEEEVDQFTIAFKEADGGQHMVLSWIKTEVRVPFTPAS